MPDFERVLDDLRVHMAPTDRKRAYAKGFNAGKSHARKEFLYVTAFCISLTSISVVLSILW